MADSDNTTGLPTASPLADLLATCRDTLSYLDAQMVFHHTLAEETSETVADAALKMGHLCGHLRSFLNSDNPGELWAYRLAEGIHDDLEALAVMDAAVREGRDMLKEKAA